MFSRSAILSSLALAGYASAQSNSCRPSATATIQNQGDADAISGCRTFSGSIAIATGTAGNIAINGVRVIDGDLVADNAVSLPGLAADSLERIDGTFKLVNMTLLTSLSFPRLSEVTAIDWTTLPRLESLGFATGSSGGVESAESIAIYDSQLSSLSGINLETVGAMTIVNNNQLNTIDMQLNTITQSFVVQGNGRQMNLTFPNLVNAYNMTIRNASGVSIPSLASVNGSLGFYSCNFENIAAPNLTAIGGSLSFVSNPQLQNISFPRLTSVRGAIQVANNTAYETIDGFPAVETIQGAFDCYGNFSSVELPKIENVAGAFNLQSTSDIQETCDRFRPLAGRDRAIKGAFTCEGEQSNPGGVGSPTEEGSSSTQSGAGSRELYARSASITGVMGVLAALFGML